jgi:hypothetical protein
MQNQIRFKQRFSLQLCLLLFFLAVSLQGQAPTDEIFLPFPKESSEGENFSSSPLTTVDGMTKEDSDKKESSNRVPNNIDSSKEADKTSVLDPKPINTVSNEASPPKPKKKKKGKGDAMDPTEPPFNRGKSLLTRNQKKSAETEFADSYTKEGLKANPSRTENANLFGLDAKNTDGVGLVEKIEDPDAKIKAQFELARSLDRPGSNDSEEKAYKEYLKLVTSFPIHAEITPRAHLAIAVLLFRRQEYRPSLHHLVKIMKEFKNSKDFSTAHYYAGRIYESVWQDRDLERAKKYYDFYLKESEGKEPTPGNDFKKDASERRRLIEPPIGI